MVRKLIVPVLAILASMLAACASPASPAAAPQTINASASDSGPTASAPADLARTDSQGSVEFVVTPTNLAAPGETLDFDISMNTHSVDLSWNLAAQSVLTTDTGLEVKGLSWPVGSGHHYEGTLIFPAKTADGKSLLDGAKKLTLTIRDAGAQERVFEWEVSQ
jgi:hypothetical protein